MAVQLVIVLFYFIMIVETQVDYFQYQLQPVDCNQMQLEYAVRNDNICKFVQIVHKDTKQMQVQLSLDVI